MKKHTLQEYIRFHGVEKCAREWGFSPRAVESWMYGARVPKRKNAEKIIRSSSIDWDGIYGRRAAA